MTECLLSTHSGHDRFRPIAVVRRLSDEWRISDANLTWLMQWYLAECNDDWEHSYGVKIDTLDNPGWTLKIDLRETDLLGRPFKRVVQGEPASNLDEWRSLGSWLVADVEGDVFDAACGPLDLTAAIQVFRDWVETAQS